MLIMNLLRNVFLFLLAIGYSQLLSGANSSTFIGTSSLTMGVASVLAGIGGSGVEPYHSLQGYPNNSISYAYGITGSATSQVILNL